MHLTTWQAAQCWVRRACMTPVWRLMFVHPVVVIASPTSSSTLSVAWSVSLAQVTIPAPRKVNVFCAPSVQARSATWLQPTRGVTSSQLMQQPQSPCCCTSWSMALSQHWQLLQPPTRSCHPACNSNSWQLVLTAA